MIERVSGRAKWTREDVDMYLMHQATLFMLDHLRERLSLDCQHTPEALEQYGNTVSSTIPILIRDLRQSGRLRPGKQTVLVGFGVGLSWAGCAWTETWSARQVQAADKTVQETAEPAAAETAAEPTKKTVILRSKTLTNAWTPHKMVGELRKDAPGTMPGR